MMTAKMMTALGAMSGTSLDGVDAAMILTDGVEIGEFGDCRYRAYSAPERAILKSALGRWPHEDTSAALAVLQSSHLDVLGRFKGAQVLGFHGQTLAHEPSGRGTHQLGDGAGLADALGVPVVWDFRSEDVLAGGQGAPLAPFFHFACAKWMGAGGGVAFLNLGGVGNLTWVDPSKPGPESQGALLAFDTGPANAPLNDLMMERRGLSCDDNGQLAQQGRVDEAALERFLHAPYFHMPPPKSLDRDGFPEIPELVKSLDDADAAATLCAMVAGSVARGINHCPKPPGAVYVTGGGRKNPVIMQMLSSGLGCPVQPVEAAGLNGDMLEAQAFGYLAVRVLRGMPTSSPTTTGARKLTGGGIVSYPAH